MASEMNQPAPGFQPGADFGNGHTGTTEEAQGKASQAAGQAQEKVQQASAQAQSKLRQQVSERSNQAAEQIHSQASDLRSVSQTLREQGKDGPAKAADQVADYGERLGGYLKDKDPDDLLSDVEDFARRQPWTFAAGGLALGFAASRFLKASSARRYRGAEAGTRQPGGVHPSSVNVPSEPPPGTSGVGTVGGTPATSPIAPEGPGPTSVPPAPGPAPVV